MAKIRVEIPQSLGLSDDQLKQLRAQFTNQLL